MTLTDTNISVGEAIQPLPISPPQVNGKTVWNAHVKALQADNQTGQHSSLRLTVILPMLDVSTLLNKPFYIRYGSHSAYSYFYGYINNVSKPQSINASDAQIEIFALGFSSIMKMSPSRIFVKQTTRQILETILPPYRIGLAAQDHPFVHQRIAQVDISDWEFAVKVAAMAGYNLHSHSGALVMTHPVEILNKHVADRVLEKSSQTLDDRPLLEFLPNERTDSSKLDYIPEFTYFTANGGMQNNIPDDVPPQRRMKIHDYIYSPEYAQFILDGVRVMTGLYQTADARVRGDAGIRPGMVVDIRTGATLGATDNFDGLWYVDTASTFIDNKVFQTALKLCRDRYRRPHARDQQAFLNASAKRFPTMKIGSDGVWQSSWSK